MLLAMFVSRLSEELELHILLDNIKPLLEALNILSNVSIGSTVFFPFPFFIFLFIFFWSVVYEGYFLKGSQDLSKWISMSPFDSALFPIF